MLVPLKVKIALKTEKGRRVHAYPPFNEIPAELRDNTDWCYFVDLYGGWHYDCCGHDEDDEESPRGVWFGMLIVPEAFAIAAVEQWPEQCSILNEQQAEQFYEGRVTVNEPDVIEDLEVLQVIAAKRQAGIAEDESDRAALDPDNPKRGRRKNDRKRFADMLKKRGLKLKR